MNKSNEPDIGTPRIVWTQPREWRQHPLGNEPYWVEEEVVLQAGDQQLAQLGFDEPLDPDTRGQYERALHFQVELASEPPVGLADHQRAGRG